MLKINSILNVIVGRNIRSKFVIVQEKFIFSESFLKIDKLREEQSQAKELMVNKENVQKSINNQIDKKNFSFIHSQLNKLLIISSTNDDVMIFIQTLKKVMPLNIISPDEIRGLIVKLLRLLYTLNKMELGLELYNDSDLKGFVKGSYGSLIIMNYLLINKQYEKLIEIFQNQFDEYSKHLSYSKNSPNHFRQAIPFDQLDCVSEALLKLNSQQSIENLKSLIKRLDEKKCNFGRRSVARLFLLCINQNQPKLALELVHNNQFSIDLRLNLEIIALCHLGKLSNANILANEMFTIKSNSYDKYSGKFFPLVLKSFERSIKDFDPNGLHLENYKKLRFKIKLENRLGKFDLKDYCS